MPRVLPLADIAGYHIDAQASLKLYYSNDNPNYSPRFATYLLSEIASELKERISESEMRSAFIILARVEAAFRQDYIERCRMKKADSISIAFRKVHKKRDRWARLDEDIMDIWAQNIEAESRKFISELRGMLKFRHWLAHGRYWNLGNKHSYQDVYLLAEAILKALPLCS